MLSCSSNIRRRALQSRFSLCWTKPYLPAQGSYRFIKSKRPQGCLYLREVFSSTFAKSFLSDLRFVFPSSPPVKKRSAITFKNLEPTLKSRPLKFALGNGGLWRIYLPIKRKKNKINGDTLTVRQTLSDQREREKKHYHKPKTKTDAGTYSTHITTFLTA